MGKLLRALVFVFLALSIGALALGWMLFNKRELLKGRTQKLESAVVELSATIESEPATLDRRPDYPSRDISMVTSELLDNPELSTFWDNYSNELEVTDLSPISISQEQRLQMMRYYKINPATGKKDKDALGQLVTGGPGTMQEVLQGIIDKATQQSVRLNNTRQQLKSARVELVDTIGELNSQKNKSRQNLKEIEGLKDDIARLNNEVRNLTTQVENLTEEKRALEDTIAGQKEQIALLQETQLENEAKIAALDKENADLRKQLGRASGDEDGTVRPPVVDVGVGSVLETGVKGEIIDVDNQWNFVIVKLSDAAMRELLGEDLSGALPTYELMVKRPDDGGKFVTKIQLRSVKKDENLVIADILTNWQQVPVEKGDVVFQ